MKVMIIAPYIYDDNIIEFTKNKTGFGIMVQNIVSSVAELENVVLLTRVINILKKSCTIINRKNINNGLYK